MGRCGPDVHGDAMQNLASFHQDLIMIIVSITQVADDGALQNSVFREWHGVTLAKVAIELLDESRLARQGLGNHASCWLHWLGQPDQPMAPVSSGELSSRFLAVMALLPID